jgi:hypothetical protein
MEVGPSGRGRVLLPDRDDLIGFDLKKINKIKKVGERGMTVTEVLFSC